MEKMHQWRAALTEASNLCGLDSKSFRPESELVQRTVGDVLKKLPQYLSSDEQYFKGLIGIKENIKEIESLLSIGSKDIRLIGIWGMGGIGKTTHARVVFQRLSHSQFESCCLLLNVREEHERHGLDHLRRKLISNLLNDETILKMDTPVEALPFNIFDRLRHKKVFIVLDDVDKSILLDDLIEGCHQLALGSRIIVTTRDKQVLRKAAHGIYKVESLNDNESLELFRLHAFRENSPTIDDEMVLKVTRYANGNPLALKVLGSFLCCRSKIDWESALKKLKRVPNLEIQNVLKISYEGLDKGNKDIFLDIACLFKSSFTRDHGESILDDGNSSVKIEISVLIENSLLENIKGRWENVLWMHDLLRQLGRAIIRDEDKEPGNRSRLSDAMEVCEVLENSAGTKAVEVISLNMFEIKKNVKVCHGAFSNMHNLRILKIYYFDDIRRNEFLPVCDNNIGGNKFKLSVPQDLDSYLSNKLRYFQWDLYPLKWLPSNFIPENLVELVLRGSRVEKLWNNHRVVSLPVLRRMDLSYSKFLTQLPDLSQSPNLESINLAGCTSLVQVLSALQNLDKLTYLNLNGCSKLRDFHEISKRTKGLSKSCIQNFTSNLCLYSTQAHISQKFAPNLSYLGLSGTTIEILPPSIGYLSGLVELDLWSCKRLKSLPTSICHLKSLESLDLRWCEKLKAFPEILEPMEHLTLLMLNGTGIKELPESIENLVSLRALYMQVCKDFEFLPNSLRNLRNLEIICLDSCSKFQMLPSLPPSLLDLAVEYCERLKSLPEVPSLCLSLSAIGCTSLENISYWRAPILLDLDITKKLNGIYDYIDFYGCEKLDQNTRNMLTDQAVIHIVSRLKFGRTSERCHDFRYPGDEIPRWFNYQTCGTSINNVMLPPYWNNDDFLGFAFCIVLHQNKINPHIFLDIDCKLDSKTIDHDHLYEYHFFTYVEEKEVSSDHVLMWYVTKPTLQEEMNGLNWPSTCSTEAFFHVWHEYYDSRVYGRKSDEIKKFGVRLVYKQDIDRLDAETVRKNKRRFNECCE
nr:disease resistance-like protein DSC1 isoform X2 [Ziziphus jujuba var. spinosa]XP_048320272.1 disease resistance-like protein DSC1 isoform X2 [Ziziphus jujuba var. spinosa]XP_048320273.1 disease resistance-like protein DSC1 isoform X2 [Ziziphus jujuba var. spinosa]